MRIGYGFDVHAFGNEGKVIIGGVHIPYKKGLLAYSDGDVALHSLIDALLGAAALGDIGNLFPYNNLENKGADSRYLLRRVLNLVQDKHYQIGNVDITVIAQEPKILPYVPQMRIFIAEDLNTHLDNVSIKSTTTEKLGFIGRREGIASEAIVLLNEKRK